MSIILYSNGLTEEYRCKNMVFDDEELIGLFPDFDTFRTHRLVEIPNTWCIWGENDPIDEREDEYNQLASTLIDTPVYSPIFFVHDTEIDPSWKLTDDIIQYGYQRFKSQLLKFFDSIAMAILEEQDKLRKQEGYQASNLIMLEQTGVSPDKRIVYKFDLSKQSSELLQPQNFLEFSIKVHDFLKEYYADGDIFVIYADKNILIELDDNHVKPLMDKVIDTLQIKEEYEMCADLTTVYNRWNNFKNQPKKTRKKRVPKTSSNSKIPPKKQ